MPKLVYIFTSLRITLFFEGRLLSRERLLRDPLVSVLKHGYLKYSRPDRFPTGKTINPHEAKFRKYGNRTRNEITDAIINGLREPN